MAMRIFPAGVFTVPAGKLHIRWRSIPGCDRMAAGPFALTRCEEELTLRLSRRHRVLLFCQRGSVELRFSTFSMRLTPEHVASLDGYMLGECRCEAGTVLLEYLPGDGPYHVSYSRDNHAAFALIPARKELTGWAEKFVSHLSEGKGLGRYDFCSVGVQLRDCSGGTIRFPFACGSGCPSWGSCAATVGQELMPEPSAECEGLVTETKAQRWLLVVAAVLGNGLWGGLLLYGLWTGIKDMAGR